MSLQICLVHRLLILLVWLNLNELQLDPKGLYNVSLIHTHRSREATLEGSGLIMEQFQGSVSLSGTLTTCGQELLGMEPPTLRLVDDHRSYICQTQAPKSTFVKPQTPRPKPWSPVSKSHSSHPLPFLSQSHSRKRYSGI